MFCKDNLESNYRQKHGEAGGRMSAKGGSDSGGKFESTNTTIKLLLTFFLICADQFSKYLIRQTGGFYVCNPNLAFSIKIPLILFVLFWAFIIVYLSFLIFNFQFSIFKKFLIYKFSNLQIFGLLLILSGAVSNMIDRLRIGCVLDFIDLKFWPVFNFADCFIVVGAILILAPLLKKKAI